MFPSPVFRKLPAACLLGYSLLLLAGCEDFIVGREGRSSSGAISNPSRAELERLEKIDEKRYGPRVRTRTQTIVRDLETNQIVDPSLIPTESGRVPGELVPEESDVIKQEIIDTPPAMNLKKKEKKAVVPVMEPVTPPEETPAEATPAVDPRNSRPVAPPPAVEKMVPELMEPTIPSNLR